jgi:hypothetical protein
VGVGVGVGVGLGRGVRVGVGLGVTSAVGAALGSVGGRIGPLGPDGRSRRNAIDPATAMVMMASGIGVRLGAA